MSEIDIGTDAGTISVDGIQIVAQEYWNCEREKLSIEEYKNTSIPNTNFFSNVWFSRNVPYPRMNLSIYIILFILIFTRKYCFISPFTSLKDIL